MAGEKIQLLEQKNIHLWFGGSPVVLCTMRLELDKSAGAIFAYSKMLNVQPEHIKEVVFDLICYDSVRLIVSTIENCKYTGLDIPRNGVFGMDVPIRVRDPSTRNIEFVLKSVTVTSGETWVNKDEIRFNMSLEQKSLFNVQGDLNRQFIDNCMRDGIDHTRLIFQPVFNDSYWLCACGALNWSDEESCCECGVPKKWLFDNMQSDLLKQQDDERKAAAYKIRKESEEKERLQRAHDKETFEKRKAEYERQLQKQKSRKTQRRFVLVLIIFLVLFGGGFLFFKYAIPYINYQNAVTDMNRANYDSAIEKFEKMSGYLDSDELKLECLYKKAIDSFYARNYDVSAEIFLQLGTYEDSQQKYTESLIGTADGLMEQEMYSEAYGVYAEAGLNCDTNANMKKCANKIYNAALEELEGKHFADAYTKFSEIGDFKKSAEYANECQYMLAKRSYDRCEYGKAIDIYSGLGEYKDTKKIIEKLKNLMLVLSAAADDETPAVWETVDTVCPKCGNNARYVFEFYKTGKCYFKVECENGCENEGFKGRFKIENNTLYLSKYVGGILKWEKRADIKSVKQDEHSVDGKNTAIVITDPLNNKKNNITLYGNNISDGMISIT